MNITHIVASLDNAAAGPSYSVPRLTEVLAARGHIVELMSTTNELTAGDLVKSCQERHRLFAPDFCGPRFGKLTCSGGLRAAIDDAAVKGRILHSHGLWLMPNLYSALSAKRHKSVHIISPRGMLGDGAIHFSRWRKRLCWILAQSKAVHAASCLHATSRKECDDIRELGINAPIAIIPNGVDLPASEVVPIGGDAGQKSIARTLLYLGRLHPKKGIDRLLEAWARVEAKHSEWRLRIVGPSENGYRHKLEVQAQALGLSRVSFKGALFDAEKDAAYQAAELFVLPTLDENFGMVVAEALSHAKPVICTRGAPWQDLERYRCGWWVDHGVAPLSAALGQALAMPKHALAEKGRRGRAWVAHAFSWESVALEMEQVYRWCSAGGARPKCLNVVR